MPLCRGLCISRFSSPQQPAVFELQTRTAPSVSSWKRGLKCSARSSASQPRSIWNLSGSENKQQIYWSLNIQMFAELRTIHKWGFSIFFTAAITQNASALISPYYLIQLRSKYKINWMCWVHLPLSIMQNYPFYFQLISSSQIHILQFKLLKNTVVQFNNLIRKWELTVSYNECRLGKNQILISVRYVYSTKYRVQIYNLFMCSKIKAETKQINLPCSFWVLVNSPGADRRYRKMVFETQAQFSVVGNRK